MAGNKHSSEALAGPDIAEVAPPILLCHGHTARQTGANRDEKMLVSTEAKPNANAEYLAAIDLGDSLHACGKRRMVVRWYHSLVLAAVETEDVRLSQGLGYDASTASYDLI